MTATTVRFPDELGARLEDYCARTGAVKNRVVALALRSYLGDGEDRVPALPVARRFDEPEPELPAHTLAAAAPSGEGAAPRTTGQGVAGQRSLLRNSRHSTVV
jgi:predicted DNA-binding protein